jgi:hypothetical protein
MKIRYIASLSGGNMFENLIFKEATWSLIQVIGTSLLFGHPRDV